MAGTRKLPFTLPGLGLTLLTQGSVQARPDLIRKRIKLPITIKLDGFPRGVEHNLAMMATLEMVFQSAPQVLVQIFIQIVRDFLKSVFAIH
jgi:hypothetical protein